MGDNPVRSTPGEKEGVLYSWSLRSNLPRHFGSILSLAWVTPAGLPWLRLPAGSLCLWLLMFSSAHLPASPQGTLPSVSAPPRHLQVSFLLPFNCPSILSVYLLGVQHLPDSCLFPILPFFVQLKPTCHQFLLKATTVTSSTRDGPQ